MKYSVPFKFSAVAIITVLWMAGCAQNPTQELPDWVVAPPPSSQNKAYAVGSADSSGTDAQLLALAKQNARMALAQQLNTTLSGTTQVQTRQTQIDQSQTAFEQSLKQDVQAQVYPLELSGVTIEKTYIEPKPEDAPPSYFRSAYALASVNKAENIARLQNRLLELDEQVKHFLTLESKDTHVQNLLALAPALTVLEKRAVVKRQLVSLNPTFPTHVGDDNAHRLSAQLHQLLSELTVDIIADADQPTAFRSKLQGQLQTIGFTPGGTEADLHIITELTPTQDFSNGLYYHFYEGIVQLTDRKHNPILSFSSASKGVSQYPQKAEQQALSNLAQQIAQQLKQRLIKGSHS